MVFVFESVESDESIHGREQRDQHRADDSSGTQTDQADEDRTEVGRDEQIGEHGVAEPHKGTAEHLHRLELSRLLRDYSIGMP